MILRFVLSAFQHCCLCRAPTLKPTHLCDACWALIRKEFELWSLRPKSPQNRGYPLLSLGNYRSPPLALWIKALKGGDQKSDYGQIAIEWQKRRQILAFAPLIAPVTLIPSPSRRDQQPDHAYQLAHAVSELTGWELRNSLRFQLFEDGPQKRKKVAERRERRLKWAPGEKIPSGTLIFIDDVVTTGSTAEAAWKALGQPKHFEVWCVAEQPKLAPLNQV